MQALKDIREIRGEVPVVFFGPAPSDRPAEFVVDGNTYVVRGEPEYTMLELVKALEAKSIINGTKSVSFRAKGEITHNANREPIEDLDSLPFPARHLLEEKDVYYNPKLGLRPFYGRLYFKGLFISVHLLRPLFPELFKGT